MLRHITARALCAAFSASLEMKVRIELEAQGTHAQRGLLHNCGLSLDCREV